jgi:hypothetical protein
MTGPGCCLDQAAVARGRWSGAEEENPHLVMVPGKGLTNDTVNPGIIPG